jgi:hypothetical protein
MKILAYLFSLTTLIFGLYKQVNSLIAISIVAFFILGAWELLLGKKNRTKEELDWIRENGDVSGGE